jgi:hypothetical protein
VIFSSFCWVSKDSIDSVSISREKLFYDFIGDDWKIELRSKARLRFGSMELSQG